VEFNSRFGDPETQVVLPIFHGDLATLLMSAATGSLSRWHSSDEPPSNAAAVCVVLASSGYPDNYVIGKPIRGIDAASSIPGITVFHAGTRKAGSGLETAGGRVLGVTALDSSGDIAGAINLAYRAVSLISFDGMHYRKDIGQKALLRHAGLH
jgi:phosphoribosylamine--glycine ligase